MRSCWAKKESQVGCRVAFKIESFKLQTEIRRTDTIDKSPRIQIFLAIPGLACAFSPWKGRENPGSCKKCELLHSVQLLHNSLSNDIGDRYPEN